MTVSRPAPQIRAFFDQPTNTISYLVADPVTRRAAVIDPVLDFDQRDGTVDIAFGRSHSGRGERGEADDRVGAGDPCARRSSVGCALYQIQNRRADRHRRAHQGRAAHLPARVQCRRPADGRQRFRPPVRGRRDVRHRRARRRGPAHAGPYAGRPVATRSAMPCSSATRCSCPITAPRAPIFRAATRTSSIVRSSGSCAAAARRACSCATTTRRPAATTTPGKPRSREQRANNVHLRRTASRRRSSSPCGRRATRHCRAAAAAAVHPGQHPRRPLPERRGEWRALPAAAGSRAARRRRGYRLLS